jgi:hypothetical protein
MARRSKSAVPDGYHTVTPQLTLDNASEAIDWYKKAIGAEEIGRMKDDEGRVLHAELRLGNSRIMLKRRDDGQRPEGVRRIAGFALHVSGRAKHVKRASTAARQLHRWFRVCTRELRQVAYASSREVDRAGRHLTRVSDCLPRTGRSTGGRQQHDYVRTGRCSASSG